MTLDAEKTPDSAEPPARTALRDSDKHTVVFIHGFLDEGSLWQPVSNALAAKDITSVMLDLPGMGNRTADPGPFTLHRLAHDVAKAVDKLEHSVVLVGHSMGAQIAELVAVACPDRVVALLLLTPVPLGGLPVPNEIASAMRALGGNSDVQRNLRRQFSGPNVENVLDKLVSIGMKVRATTVEALFEAWSKGAIAGQSESLFRGPVLVASGSDDSFITQELLDSLVSPRFPKVATASIQGAGHWPHVEQPAAVAEIITGFMTDNI